MSPDDSNPSTPPTGANAGRILTWWFGAMSAAGLAFGSLAEQRPFGNDVLAHPLVIFFAIVAGALLILRLVSRRPAPALIGDRMLLVGCGVGLIAFLIGNWFGTHLGAMR